VVAVVVIVAGACGHWCCPCAADARVSCFPKILFLICVIIMIYNVVHTLYIYIYVYLICILYTDINHIRIIHVDVYKYG